MVGTGVVSNTGGVVSLLVDDGRVRAHVVLSNDGCVDVEVVMRMAQVRSCTLLRRSVYWVLVMDGQTLRLRSLNLGSMANLRRVLRLVLLLLVLRGLFGRSCLLLRRLGRFLGGRRLGLGLILELRNIDAIRHWLNCVVNSHLERADMHVIWVLPGLVVALVLLLVERVVALQHAHVIEFVLLLLSPLVLKSLSVLLREHGMIKASTIVDAILFALSTFLLVLNAVLLLLNTVGAAGHELTSGIGAVGSASDVRIHIHELACNNFGIRAEQRLLDERVDVVRMDTLRSLTGQRILYGELLSYVQSCRWAENIFACTDSLDYSRGLYDMSELLMDWHVVAYAFPVSMLTIVVTKVPVVVIEVLVKTSGVFRIPEMRAEVIIVQNSLFDKVLIRGLLKHLLLPFVLFLLSVIVRGWLWILVLFLVIKIDIPLLLLGLSVFGVFLLARTTLGVS